MSSTQQNTIYSICEYNFPEMKKRLNKLNKKAIKLGCSPITYQIKDERFGNDPEIEAQIIKLYGCLQDYSIPQVKFYDIELCGIGPKVEGYKFIGTLDHYTFPGQVVVRPVPGETIPNQFYTCDPICSHCNKWRRRVETFVLFNEQSQQYLQVGRTCLRDFLGYDLSKIARFVVLITEFIDDVDEQNFGSNRAQYYYDPVDVLEKTVAIIRTFGWVAKSKCDVDQTPTCAYVLDLLNPPTSSSNDKHTRFVKSIKFDKQQDHQQALDALGWLTQQDGTKNEYIHNLKLVQTHDRVPERMLGLWCSLVASFQRSKEKEQINKNQKRTNEYVGEVKQRIELEVTCKTIKYLSGYYGAVTLHNMIDNQGRTVVWFSHSGQKLDPDLRYKIKGTIQKHDLYNNWKQTKLTRVNVIQQLE